MLLSCLINSTGVGNTENTCNIFGSRKDLRDSTPTPLGLTWCKSVKALGIVFTYNAYIQLQKKNFYDKLKDIRTHDQTRLWSCRGLSLYGKVTIIKEPIHMASVLVWFTFKPEQALNWSSRRKTSCAHSVLGTKTERSSAYWTSLNSSFPILRPWISALLWIAIANVSATIINK